MMRSLMSAAALAAALGTAVVAAPGCEAKVETPTGPGTIQIHIHGLAKPADVEKATTALEGVDGVEKVKIDEAGNAAIAVKDQAVTTAPKLVKALSDAGYQGHTGGH